MVLMLTRRKILTLFEEGVTVKVHLKGAPEGTKGTWREDGDARVDLYPQNMESREDFDLTLLHEFEHAVADNMPRGYNVQATYRKKEQGSGGYVQTEDCDIAEAHAVDLYRNDPEIVRFIKTTFNVRNPLKD